jgi:hypothetical protein
LLSATARFFPNRYAGPTAANPSATPIHFKNSFLDIVLSNIRIAKILSDEGKTLI